MTYYKPWIAQKDETCDNCGAEIQKGSPCYLDRDALSDTGIICLNCFYEEEENNFEV